MHVLVILVSSLQIASSANILCFFPAPSYSHQITYQPIWRELAVRGHNVTVITPNPLKDNSIPNLREIDVHDISYNTFDKFNISSFGVDEELHSTSIQPFIHAMMELTEVQLNHPEVQEIIHNTKKENYDIVLIEMVPHAYPLKLIYNCPMVILSSMPLHFNLDEYMGNVNHPIVSPDLNLPFSRNLSFFQRVQSVAHNLIVRTIMYQFQSILDTTVQKHYKTESWMDLLYQPYLVLMNFNPVFHPRKPLSPNFIEFNGIHINPPKPLPTDLKQFLDNSKQGVIYMSFGSNIKSTALGTKKLNIILETFSKLPHNFLWKFEADDIPNKPNNVEIRKWIPQQDVLRHPNVKLFITQGGLQSLDEAMYTKTPVVVIPFFGDQYGNARKVVDIGMGSSIYNTKLTVETFTEIILEGLAEKYVKRAEELHNIVTDQPMTGLNKTVWWIEYVLRHKDITHLRTAALNIPWYQYFMVDVIGFFLLILCVILYSVYYICKLLLRYICRLGKMKQN